MNGRAEILNWIKVYPRNRLARHCSTNQIVDVIDADNAVGNSYAMVFRQYDPVEGVPFGNVTPRSLSDYKDKFRRTEDGWRIAERQYQYGVLKEE